MAEPTRKYERIVCEFEVEVIDEIAMRSKLLEIDDDLADSDVARAVHSVVAPLIHEELEKFGVRWLGGSMFGRHVDENGDYPELTFPSMPGREPNGDLRDVPGGGAE
jgi:hypothetical protein